MGQYTGFRWLVKVHERHLGLAEQLFNDDFRTGEIDTALYPEFDVDAYHLFRRDERSNWLSGGSCDLIECHREMSGQLLAFSGSVKNHDSVIEKFADVLALLGDNWVILTREESYAVNSHEMAEEEVDVITSDGFDWAAFTSLETVEEFTEDIAELEPSKLSLFNESTLCAQQES